jgi:urease accessory protein
MYAESAPNKGEPPSAFVSVAPRLQRSRGRAAVRFKLDGVGRTVLADLAQSAPCLAIVPKGDYLPTAAFISTCGGLTSGDEVAFDLELSAGASAIATTQAAEKIYCARPGDPPACLESRVVVGEGAYCEWLPQETILFDGSKLQRRTVFQVAETAQLLACELRVLGRAAHGEVYGDGFLSDRIELWRGDELSWVDALRLAPGEGALQSSVGFGGYMAIGTILYAAPDAEQQLPTARDILDGSASKCAATAWDNLLIVRILAADVFQLRTSAAHFVTGFRAHLGRAPVMPRFWSL